MLQSVSEIEGYRIRAVDGPLGDVHDLRFRDCSWAVRYLVVDTGHWLPGRKVLIPTDLACAPDIVARELAVTLSRERMKEIAADAREAEGLHSARDVIGLPTLAADEQAGHVYDLLFDDATWVIRYLVIDTSSWLTGRKVLISPAWAREVDRRRGVLALSLDRNGVRLSPIYDPAQPIDRDYEAKQDRLVSCRRR